MSKQDTRYLTLPDVERVRYERNMIHQVFCEFRFPTLPEFDNEVPRDFAKSIGRDYPHYEHGVGMKFGITDKGMEQIPQGTHRFVSRDKNTTIWLRTSSFGIENRAYIDFERFLSQIRTIAENFKPHIDTDFYTRVGLRYINVIPAEPTQLDGWINSSLLGPFASDIFGEVEHHWCETRGKTELGGFTLRHGVVNIESQGPRYVLDTDFYSEGVECENAFDHLKVFNSLNFRLFSWAIGENSRQWLGAPIPK